MKRALVESYYKMANPWLSKVQRCQQLKSTNYVPIAKERLSIKSNMYEVLLVSVREAR